MYKHLIKSKYSKTRHRMAKKWDISISFQYQVILLFWYQYLPSPFSRSFQEGITITLTIIIKSRLRFISINAEWWRRTLEYKYTSISVHFIMINGLNRTQQKVCLIKETKKQSPKQVLSVWTLRRNETL